MLKALIQSMNYWGALLPHILQYLNIPQIGCHGLAKGFPGSSITGEGRCETEVKINRHLHDKRRHEQSVKDKEWQKHNDDNQDETHPGFDFSHIYTVWKHGHLETAKENW